MTAEAAAAVLPSSRSSRRARAPAWDRAEPPEEMEVSRRDGKLYQGAHAHPSLGQSFGISLFHPLSRVLCPKTVLKGSKNYEALLAPGWIFQSS